MNRLVVAACLIGVVVAAWYLWPTETRAVQARVTSVVEALNTRPGETDLQRMARAASLASALAPDVTVVLDQNRRIEGREMVLGLARQTVQTRRDLRLELVDLDVGLGATRTTATANVTVRIDDGTYQDVRLELVKRESAWLVHRAEVIHPLERPDLGN